LTNDIKATHSSSISQLDEERIFMMSRGLDKALAIKMITLGFFEQALARLNNPSVKETERVFIP
jgi:Fe-S cluster assembly scaffold protein SufB